MLTGGGLALANEFKDQSKRVFRDMKLFDIGATVEKAVAGLAQFGLDFPTVHGDPQVVRAATRGRGTGPTKILAVTILTSLDRTDLDEMLIRPLAFPGRQPSHRAPASSSVVTARANEQRSHG